MAGDRYEAMEMAVANDQCRERDSQQRRTCPQCQLPIMLHCSTCKIQVTGCLCTEIDRFGQDEAWKRAVEMFGEELARDRYRHAGLYVPSAPTPDKLIVPGQEN